jgi:hypothetical protein
MSLLTGFLNIGGMGIGAEYLEANERYGKYLKRAQQAAYYAKISNELRGVDSAFAQNIDAISTRLDSVTEGLDKVEGAVTDLRALNSMGRALDAITVNSIRADPRKAARNFGVVFVNAGQLARHLPFPLSAFGAFLSEFDTFFVDLYEKLAPDGANRTMGRQIRYINQIDPIP